MHAHGWFYRSRLDHRPQGGRWRQTIVAYFEKSLVLLNAKNGDSYALSGRVR